MNNRLRWAITGITATAGIEIDIHDVMILRRLANRHQYQCVNACNGEGYIPRKGFYTTGKPESLRAIHSAYVNSCPDCGSTDLYWPKKGTANEDVCECGKCGKLKSKDELDTNEATIFDQEIESLEFRITNLAKTLGLVANFQRDPRGLTVKLLLNNSNFKDSRDMSELLYI